MFAPYSNLPGGFSTNDGTIDFYLRVRSLLFKDAIVVDLGAGRAAWFEDDIIEARKNIRNLRNCVGELIAIDVDEAVLENRSSTKNMVYDGGELPFADESVDIVVADYVLEHVEDPVTFVREVARVLKPGGSFCGRTPHKYNYVCLAARIVENQKHAALLKKIQPNRKAVDVFPTQYKLNRLCDIGRHFDGFENSSFLFRSDPAYYFGSRFVYRILVAFHHFMPVSLIGNIHAFLVKR